MGKREKWGGGYIHREEDGRPHYVIERERGGKRFHIFTGAHSDTAAHAHLTRFEANPSRYAEEQRNRAKLDVGVFITNALILEFSTWLEEHGFRGKATRKHANEMGNRLGDWMEDLKGRDLRSVDLATLKACINRRQTCRQHRVIAIKSFARWMREEKHLLDRADDATLDLRVPQASPEKHRRRKAVPIEHVRAAMAHLAPAYRDCLLLLSRVGWHVTELARFARDEESRIVEGRGDTLAVLQTRHKTGAQIRTPVLETEALDAAKRIRERGELPRRMNATLAAACRAANVPEFTFGVCRHSVATWAIEAGTPAEIVADFLNHRDKRTTLVFYADVAVPTPAIRLPKL